METHTKRRVLVVRWFFPVMAALLALTVFAGFAPSYYLRPDNAAPLSPLFRIHGAVFTVWFLVFVTQAGLIRAGQVTAHRWLGAASVLLVPLIVVFGLEAGFDALDRGMTVLDYPPETFFFMSFTDVWGFVLLFTAALLTRAHTDWHKRLMLLAAISLVLPAAGRLADQLGMGPAGVGVQLGFVGALFLFDWLSQARFHGASLLGGGVIGLKLLGIVTIGASEAWRALVPHLRF